MGYKGNVFNVMIEGIEPLENIVQNDSYPIIQYLQSFVVKTPIGVVKNFIDWVLSPSANM